jgi:hypothetical protein
VSKSLLSVASLSSRPALVETCDVSPLESRRGVVLVGEVSPAAAPRFNRTVVPTQVRHSEPEAKEDAMPKGQYDRSKAKKRGEGAVATPAIAASAAEQPERKPHKPAKAAKKKRKVAKAKPRRAAHHVGATAVDQVAAFGFFEDGSLLIDAPDCKGKLSAAIAGRLSMFLSRLKGE